MRLPEYDTHFQHYAKKGYYQRQIILLGMSFVKCWDTAVDVGAHVGWAANDMAKFFAHVHAFEPIPDNVECLRENTPDNVIVHPTALSDREGRTNFETPAPWNSGAWEMADGDMFHVEHLDKYHLENVGLIKIDTQGAELKVLKGAEGTLLRNKPIVVVECVGKCMDEEALLYMHGLGASLVISLRNDGVWKWT